MIGTVSRRHCCHCLLSSKQRRPRIISATFSVAILAEHNHDLASIAPKQHPASRQPPLLPKQQERKFTTAATTPGTTTTTTFPNSSSNSGSTQTKVEEALLSRNSNNTYTKDQQQQRQEREPLVTDEGVIIHESDPSASGDGLGLVWGSVVWSSGTSLAKYCHYYYNNHNKNSDRCLPRRVLELGAGTGVVGLTLAKLAQQQQQQDNNGSISNNGSGNCRITLTDSESALWPILRKSIVDNGFSSSEVVIESLDWRDPSSFLMPPRCSPFDLVVAADVLYSGMDKLFARALAAHLPGPQEIIMGCDRHNNNDKEETKTTTTTTPPEALIACPYRKDSPLKTFLEACDRLGLVLERLENENGLAAGCVKGVKAREAFEGSVFVPLDDDSKKTTVATDPRFTPQNQEKVQIFRVRRVRGCARDAASIRRIARI